MRVATFNANSIRVRLDIVLDWLAENEPDVLAIQETKCEDDKFPRDAFEEAGWQVAFHGQKSYNGVAIVSREPIQNPSCGFCDPIWPDDCRILAAEVGGVKFVNTYVPNGTKVGTDKFEYKLRWLARFGELIRSTIKPADYAIWLGDINIAPTADDVYEPEKKVGEVGFHPDEHAALQNLLAFGWVDTFRKFTPGPGHYTYWDFFIKPAFSRNLGWRIDHIYATPALAEKCASCVIDKGPRGLERPSDHTFVMAEFDV